MKYKTIVFEPNMNSPAHSEINAGLLTIIQNIYEDNELVFLADEIHYEAIIEKCSLLKWRYKKIQVFSYTPKYFLVNEFILIIRILKIFLLNKNVENIFLLGILPISHLLVSVLNTFFKKNIFIALHGQMEAYLPNTMIGKTKFYYLLSKKIFRKDDGLRYLIFGKSIENNIDFLFSDNNKKIVINQPYRLNNVENSSISTLQSPIILGVIGRADKGKNIKQLFELIDLLKFEIDEGFVEIKIIGKLSFPIESKYEKYLTYYKDFVTSEIFNIEISSINFALSFTDEKFYRATPSGVLFDCIKWNIPILALRNDYISYYFRSYGDFGKLFSSTQDMASYIRDLVKNKDIHNLEISRINSVFYDLKCSLSVENIEKELKEQL